MELFIPLAVKEWQLENVSSHHCKMKKKNSCKRVLINQNVWHAGTMPASAVFSHENVCFSSPCKHSEDS